MEKMIFSLSFAYVTLNVEVHTTHTLNALVRFCWISDVEMPEPDVTFSSVTR